MEKTFDATDKKLGRLATQIATALMGKDSPDYKAHEVADVTVVVNNASKLNISDTKLKNKTYDHYSGYPGGRREQTAQDIVEKKGYSEIVRRAVWGMLPTNRLRKPTMKNLVVNE